MICFPTKQKLILNGTVCKAMSTCELMNKMEGSPRTQRYRSHSTKHCLGNCCSIYCYDNLYSLLWFETETLLYFSTTFILSSPAVIYFYN